MLAQSVGVYYKLAAHKAIFQLRRSVKSLYMRQLDIEVYSRNIHTSLNLSTRQPGDHYKTLGLTRNATQKDIKEAYFKAAKKLHPDVTGRTDRHSNSHFHSINEAYEILSNNDTKMLYDMQHGGYQRPIRQRYRAQTRQWNRETGHYEDMPRRSRPSVDEHFGKKEDDTPYTHTEYMTFTYCAIVAVFAIYVLYLFL